MMYASRAYKQYQQTQITSANQKTLIVMLYGGAMRFVAEARSHILKNDLAGKGVAIGKAADIINELQNSLNFDVGGEIAPQLSNLYVHMNQHLTEANFSNQTQHLDRVLDLLGSLKDAWEAVPARNH